MILAALSDVQLLTGGTFMFYIYNIYLQHSHTLIISIYLQWHVQHHIHFTLQNTT